MIKTSIAEHSECLRIHNGSTSYFYIHGSGQYRNAMRIILQKDPTFKQELEFKDFYFDEKEFEKLVSRNPKGINEEIEIEKTEIENNYEEVEQVNEEKIEKVNGNSISFEGLTAQKIVNLVLDKTGEMITIGLKNKKPIIKKACKILESHDILVH